MTKFFLNSIVFMLTLMSYSQTEKTNFKWDIESEREHNKNRNDSTTWDKKNLLLDNQAPPGMIKPMDYGAFPVPEYKLIKNNFVGLASSGDWKGISVKDKKIVFIDMQYALKDKKAKSFFTVVVLTDSIASDGYSHMNVFMNSRNHPHWSIYLVQKSLVHPVNLDRQFNKIQHL